MPDNMILFWLIAIVALTVIEIASVQLVSIWFAIASVCAMIAALCGAPLLVQWIVFLVVSIVLLIVSRPIYKKFIKKDMVETNAQLDVGKKAVVIEDIDAKKMTGRVRLNGVDWSAKCSSDEYVPAGTDVIVEKIDGTTLIVKEEK